MGRQRDKREEYRRRQVAAGGGAARARPFDGIVRLRRRVAEYADEEPVGQLSRRLIPARHHLPRGLALPSVLPQLPRCRRSPRAARRDGHLRDDSGSGASGSVRSTRGGCGAAAVRGETPGISTRCSSRSRVADSICGARSTRTVTSWTSSCNRTGIGEQPSDQLRSYAAAARIVMPSVVHVTDQYANNRAEVSHQPTRQRERQMRRFKSVAQLQRFASVHGIVQNLFRVSRHLLRSAHHRLLRTRAFVEWDAVTCAC